MLTRNGISFMTRRVVKLSVWLFVYDGFENSKADRFSKQGQMSFFCKRKKHIDLLVQAKTDGGLLNLRQRLKR